MIPARNHELTCGFISHAQAERLRHLALRTGEPVGGIVARAIENELRVLESAASEVKVNAR